MIDKYSHVVDLRTGELYQRSSLEEEDCDDHKIADFDSLDAAREFAKSMIDKYPHRFGIMEFDGQEIEYFSIDGLPPVQNPVTAYIPRESFWGAIRRTLKLF